MNIYARRPITWPAPAPIARDDGGGTVDGGRRLFLQGVAAMVLPWRTAIARNLVCIKSGLHWTLPARHWREATAAEVREHLVAVHGHVLPELSRLRPGDLLALHDTHHEGGRFRRGGLSVTVPGYTPGSIIHPTGPHHAGQRQTG